MTDHLAELNELLAEPEALAQAVAKSGPQEGDAQRIALGLIVSAWECYRWIRALVERRLVEEARMLSRTLIDDTALLMWFVVRRGELEHLALRFFYTGVVDSERIQNAAELAGFSWVEDMKAERAKELKAICEAADEAGITLRKLPSTRQLLEELHQERLYYWHTRASQGIHSTPIGLSARLKLPEVEVRSHWHPAGGRPRSRRAGGGRGRGDVHRRAGRSLQPARVGRAARARRRRGVHSTRPRPLRCCHGEA